MPVRPCIEEEIKEKAGVVNPRYVVVCREARQQLPPDEWAIIDAVNEVVASGQVGHAEIHRPPRPSGFQGPYHNRRVAVFICGEFELEEASRFVAAFVESIGLPPVVQEYFPNRKVIVETIGWSESVPNIDMDDGLKDDLQLIAEFDKVEPISSYAFHLLWHGIFRCFHGQDYHRGSWRSSPHYLYATDLGSCTAASP